tara:strand:- start:479 stop:745 length:267 start_codon:yes stop_codon:yes gene_type:complete
MRKVKRRVKRLRLFSKRVSAKRFPTVFNPKRARKIHKMTFTALGGMGIKRYSPLTSSANPRSRLASMEVLSNTYISESFFNLPPHVTS